MASILDLPLTLDECRAAVKADFNTRLGNNLRPEVRHSVVGVIQEVTAIREYDKYLLIQQGFDAAHLLTARGEVLTDLSGVFSANRKAATNSVGQVRITHPSYTLEGAPAQITASAPIEFATTTAPIRRFQWSGTLAAGTGNSILLTRVTSVDAGVDSNLSESQSGQPLTMTYSGSDSRITALIASSGATAAIVSAFTGGSDIEGDESTRNRMLRNIRTPIAVGTEQQWINRAENFGGVDRCFIRASSSVISAYPVLNGNVNGVPSAQNLADLKSYLETFKEAGTEIRTIAFTPKVVPVIVRIEPFTTANQSAVITAINEVWQAFANLGENFPIFRIRQAVISVSGLTEAEVTSPTADVVVGPDELAVTTVSNIS